jgi:hypothetical protein
MDRNHNFEAADMRWFRLYSDLINHPKYLSLPDSAKLFWIEFLCAYSQRNSGLSLEELKIILRRRRDYLKKNLSSLVAAKLLDEDDIEVGKYSPHNWLKRQFKSDTLDPTAAQRMRKYRNAAVTVTPPRVQSTDTERNQDCSSNNPSLGFGFENGNLKLSAGETLALQNKYPNIDLRQQLTLAAASGILSDDERARHYQLDQWCKRANAAAKKPKPQKKKIMAYKV